MTQSSSIDTMRRAGALLAETAKATGSELYVVGGFVRDLCLGQIDCSDLDVVVSGDAIDFGRQMSATCGGVFTEHSKFRTATITAIPELPGGCSIDLITARSESYPKPGALPSVTPASFELDLARRDFTINTLSLSVELLSQLPERTTDRIQFVRAHCTGVAGALADLDARIVRILHPRSFIDDPTRLFRAARYAARLSATIESDTNRCAEEAVAAGAFATISWYRVLREIEHILSEDTSSAAARILEGWNVFSALELPSFLDIKKRLLAVCGASQSYCWYQIWQYGAALYASQAELEDLAARFALGKKWVRLCLRMQRAVGDERYEELPSEVLQALIAFAKNDSEQSVALQALTDRIREKDADANQN